MGIVQEIVDLFKHLAFTTVVYEYEQGLWLRNGIVQKKPIKWGGRELDDIVRQENEIIERNGGKTKCFYAETLEMPEGYIRSKRTSLPMHPDRFKTDVKLRPGRYFHWPIIDELVKESKQQRVLQTGLIGVPTREEDGKSVELSLQATILYELMDIYRAFIEVDDYEKSLANITLLELARLATGKPYAFWSDTKQVEDFEKNTLRKEIRDTATDKWGIKILDIGITIHVKSAFQRLLYEGTTPLYVGPKPAAESTNGPRA